MYFNQIDEKRRTAIYVRISTAMQKTDRQVLFSEFSRLERKPTNLLRDLEKFQSLGVYAWFSKQNLWVRDDKDERLFSELKYGKAIGEYSFAAFDV